LKAIDLDGDDRDVDNADRDVLAVVDVSDCGNDLNTYCIRTSASIEHDESSSNS
jgi:hypothetical protein